ncbi:MAG: hypothetical protein H7293_08925, partial [Candidatus Saccharibacteria bacterium]|nr:hypothetical protein [Rhodoferax sp.]
TAIAELFGADFAGSTAGASDILVVQASELGPEQGRVFSHVLMSSLAAQNRNLSLKTLTTLAHTVSHACAQAFFERKSASITMVADRIYAGQETAVLMHELVHKHGQKALGETSWRGLVDQVKNWRDREPDSVERKIYNAAIRRANAVRTPAQSVDVYDEELFAYAVESAVAMGVKPSAHGAAHGAERWLASVIESIERVGQKLTGKVPANLSTQDIVDLAYALAQLETPRYAQTVREAMQRAGLSHQLYEQPQDLPESDEASSASQLDAAAMHSLGLQEGRPAWHSALHKALSACSMKSAPAHGWLSYLKGLPNKGIKPEEIQWSTLPDWLKFQEGISNSISKAQVLGYFQDNGVQVTEVLLGGDAVRYQKAVDRLESAGFELEYDDYFGVLLARASDGEPVEPHSLTTEQFLDFTLLNSNEAENPLVDGSALYANLQLPGGKKYRELLLTTTLAASKDWSLLAQLTVEATTDGGVDRFFIARGGVMNVYPKTYSSRAEAELAIEQLIERPQSPFRSTHWSEDNVVAHIRFNEREDALGSRILFVEEIQSDWGQQGKRRGFVNDETTVEGKTASHWQSEAQDLFGKWSQSDDDIYMQWEKAIQTARALREKYKAMGLGDVVEIPSGPFVQNTQAWVSLAIRRLVAYAVENDFDRVAFINGEQSYARYAKQKCISTLEWSKSDDGCLTLNMFNAVDESWSESQYSLAAACKCIGDELFQRIMASPETQGTFSDLELVTGGDGMRFFYDTIVPGTARKVIEKLGGLLAPVAIVTPPSDNISVQPYGNRWTAVDTTAHNAVVGSFDSKGAADEFMDITQRDYTGFTITPEMYEMVGRGLPLFSVAADASTPSPASA